MNITLWHVYLFCLFHFLTLWFYILDFLKSWDWSFPTIIAKSLVLFKIGFSKTVTSYWFYAGIIHSYFNIKQRCLCCLYDIEWTHVAFLKLQFERKSPLSYYWKKCQWPWRPILFWDRPEHRPKNENWKVLVGS